MDRKLLYLRTCFWIGILLDAYAASRLGIIRFTVPGDPALVRSAGIGAALMVGWTVLLFWAERKPVERLGVLAITVVPVLFLLLANQALSIYAHGITTPDELVNLVILTLLIFLFTVAIWLNIKKPVKQMV